MFVYEDSISIVKVFGDNWKTVKVGTGMISSRGSHFLPTVCDKTSHGNEDGVLVGNDIIVSRTDNAILVGEPVEQNHIDHFHSRNKMLGLHVRTITSAC